MKKIVFLFSFITLAFAASAQITSTFDSDADGWTFTNVSTSIPVNHQTSGGYVSVTYSSNSSATVQNWIAPVKFHGNQLVRSLGMQLKFDLQQSQAGTGAGYDVLIRNGGNFIYLSGITPKPAVIPAWTSYSFTLDETGGWFYSAGAVVASRAQIQGILTNVTSIEIRGTYATNAAYTSGLDNVVLEQRILASAPVATTLSATSGKAGDIITITGSGFSTTPSDNIVSFGVFAGTKGIVQSASPTQLTVEVPEGAVYGPLTLTNIVTGLSSRTRTPFNPVFLGGGRIIPASFKNRFSISTIPIEGWFVDDFDGDGWEDFAVANNNTEDAIDIYRNLALGGELSAASFAAKITVPMPPLGGSGANGTGLWFADLDGDGKTDAVSSTHNASGSAFVTFRNTSTPGNITFEAPEYWSGGSDETPIALVTDFDGDGRPELLAGEGSFSSTAFSYFWINQNLSTPGNIEFGNPIYPFNGTVVNAFAVATAGDLDGDGKNELVITHNFGQVFTVLKNTSTPGAPSFTNAFTITTNQYNVSIHVVDMNLDGKNDLVYKISGEAGIHIRLNANSGGALVATDFTSDVVISGDLGTSGGISIADINGDGKADIVATDNTDVGVYENIYSGGVFDATAFIPAYQVLGGGASSPRVSDLNHDGKPDFVIASGASISIVENKNIHAPVISINTVSPLKGAVGSTVTITGNNFSSNLTDNEVWFGAVRATVLTATPTQLTVSVPAGAAYRPVSVRKGELSSSYHLPFATSFSSGVTFNATHFAAPVTYTLTGADYDIEVGDLDLDGKPDVVAEGSGLISRLFQNTHTSGAISTASLTAAGTTASSSGNAKLVDVDGDGKQEIVSAYGRTYPNQSTTGTISFGTEITTASADNVNFGDLNLDGKVDLAFAAPSSGSPQLFLQENLSNVGVFVSSGAFGTFNNNIIYGKPSTGGDVAIADFDNDGFSDVIVLNPATDNMSVFRNAQKLRVSTTLFAVRVDIATGDNPLRAYTADFDGDGKVDLLVSHWTGTSSSQLIVFQNTSTAGSISFIRIDLTNPSIATIATVADLDGDGKPEILTTSEAGNRFSIFKNIHTSGALSAASFAAPFNTTVTAPRGITTGDLNLDGKPEIILTRAAGLLVVYENLVSTIEPPTITSFAPASGPIGTTVTITGTNFSTTPANNIVIFGATAATVTAATTSQLTVTVPTGATYAPIAVLNSTWSLLAYSTTNFTPTFTPNKGSITVCDFSPKVDFPAEPSPYSIAIGDLDGDGKADLAVGNNGNLTVSVFRNTSTGVGNISYAAKIDLTLGAFPQSISIGDLDGDGKADLAVANHQFLNNVVSVFRNTSTVGAISYAARVNFPTDEDPSSVSVGDLDGDGKADLAVTNQLSNSVSIFRNTSTGVGNISYAAKVDFTTGTTPLSVSIGDLDGDLKPDLAVANNGSNTVSIFRNTSAGAGNISYAAKVDFTTGTTPRFVSIGDLDGDGKSDLSVANTGSNTVSVFRNTSTGAGNIGYDAKVDFTTGTGTAPVSISIGDLDGDGKADLAVANSASVSIASLSILRNTSPGVGTISYAAKVDLITGINPRSVSIGDLDGDGKADLAVANGGSASVSIIRNNPNFAGDPTLTSFTPAVGPIGTSVTITGTNFSPVPIENVVRFFNNRTATVTASTATSLTVTVPTGTTTGKISATTNCVTVISATDFTIGAALLPTITSFTPSSGPVGTTLTITGTNFSSTPANNIVAFNGTTAIVTSSTATSITTTVPVGATTGTITVTVAGNTTTSSSNFTVTTSPVISITTQPVSVAVCGGTTASFTTAASGTTNITYRWQFSTSLTGTYTDIINGGGYSNTTTASLSVNTAGNFGVGFYRCRITGDLASSVFSNGVELTINAIPIPTITSNVALVANAISICSTTTLTLSAPTGFSVYSWSNGATTSQITVSASGTYSVIVTNALGCLSPVSSVVTVTVIPSPCTNQAPVINLASSSTTIGGEATLNLLDFISDADGNLVISSLRVLQQPGSGATAIITNGLLRVNYSGIAFSGKDQLTIEVCDVFGVCAQRVVEIDVIGDIEVYNGLSPNGDNLNEIFLIKYIELLPDTKANKVTIYNRWGSPVFEVENYNNTTNVFRGLNDNGNELPSGTYFYKITFTSDRKTEIGYVTLKK